MMLQHFHTHHGLKDKNRLYSAHSNITKMKYKILAVILFISSLQIIFANNVSFDIELQTIKNQSLNIQTDTCILSGKKFKVIDFASDRRLNAVIQNNKIKIIGHLDYRIIYYVFSSTYDARMPVIRKFNEQVDFRILEVLHHAKPGEQFHFEDIIIVDESGNKLRNEVKSLLIERIE